jgi:hypothetical protein
MGKSLCVPFFIHSVFCDSCDGQQLLCATRTRIIDTGDSFASLSSYFIFNLTPFSFGFLLAMS